MIVLNNSYVFGADTGLGVHIFRLQINTFIMKTVYSNIISLSVLNFQYTLQYTHLFKEWLGLNLDRYKK